MLLSKINEYAGSDNTLQLVLLVLPELGIFPKILLMRYLLCFLLPLALFSCTGEKEPDFKEAANGLYEAMQNSRTEDAMKWVQYVFENSGARRFDEQLEWRYKEPTQVFNYYSPMDMAIVMGRMPQKTETAEYWENWCKVLTNEGWNAASFFKDEEEMYLLANYNIVIIIAHELGHYFADRHDLGGFFDENVNCRELLADKFAIGFANELSKADKRFAGLQQRYLELIKSMNASIPAENRYHFSSGALLMNHCDTFFVKQANFNDPETMQPYASAFFERHRLMLTGEAPLPPLKELVDSILWKKHYEHLRNFPLLANTIKVEKKGTWEGVYQQPGMVAFSKELEMFIIRDDEPVSISETDTITLLSSDTKGVISSFRQNISKEGEAFNLSFSFRNGKEPEQLLPAGPFAGNKIMLYPEHFLVISPQEFYVICYLLVKGGIYKAVHYYKDAGVWKAEEKTLPAGFPLGKTASGDRIGASSCVSEDGRLMLLTFTPDGSDKPLMQLFELDKKDLSATLVQRIENNVTGVAAIAMTVSKDNRLFLDFEKRYIMTWKDGKWNTLAGNAVKADRPDTDPSKYELLETTAMAVSGKNLFLLGNWTTQTNKYLTGATQLLLSWK